MFSSLSLPTNGRSVKSVSICLFRVTDIEASPFLSLSIMADVNQENFCAELFVGHSAMKFVVDEGRNVTLQVASL